jgi:glutamate racemase
VGLKRYPAPRTGWTRDGPPGVGRVLSRRDRLRRPRHVDDEGEATYVCSADPEEFAALGSRFHDEEIEAVAPATVI